MIITTISTSLLLATMHVVLPAAIISSTSLSLSVALLAISLPSLLVLFSTPRFLLVILSGSFICILFEFHLGQEEVDLHDKIGALEHILAIDSNHLVKRCGLIFVLNVEQDAQFVLSFA